jgi:hypothetical protein
MYFGGAIFVSDRKKCTFIGPFLQKILIFQAHFTQLKYKNILFFKLGESAKKYLKKCGF